MSKLDDILSGWRVAETGNPVVMPPEIKEQIKELFLELIGEDEEPDTSSEWYNGYQVAVRNIRQKVEEL